MSPQDRRDQLLDIGAGLFAGQPYEDVAMEEVAAQAGVSRALVYRYFPTKRDFFAAIFARASERLLASTPLDPAQPLREQVVAGLDNHIDYFVANARTLLVANRGALSGDPVIQAIISGELAELRARMVDAFGFTEPQRARASMVLNGWLAFVRVVCVEWLLEQSMPRDELRELCLRTLTGALGRELDQPH
jgi:AcrR family transcriptional regulator